MSKVEDLMMHPPAMAEMAGSALEFESHPETSEFVMHMDETEPGLAKLEAETEA